MLSQNKNVKIVYDYRYNEVLKITLDRHECIVEKMAEGIVELNDRCAVDLSSEKSLQYFLDRLYLNRIATRMLQYQHCKYFSK